MSGFQYFATLMGRGRGEGRLKFFEEGFGVWLGWDSELVVGEACWADFEF